MRCLGQRERLESKRSVKDASIWCFTRDRRSGGLMREGGVVTSLNLASAQERRFLDHDAAGPGDTIKDSK